MTSSPVQAFRRRVTAAPQRAGLVRAAAIVAVMALVLAVAPAVAPGGAPPAQAAQGFGPTTAIPGLVIQPDDESSFHQNSCYPAGGSAIPEPEKPANDFVFVGGGWGHGAGMSQFGAQGAARLGCSVSDILGTYYPGAQIEAVPMPSEVIIGLSQSIATLTVQAEAGDIPWKMCHYQTLDCAALPTLSAGTTWTVQILGDATYRITDGGGAVVWEGGDFEHTLEATLSPDDSVNRRVRLPGLDKRLRWGRLVLDSVTSSERGYLTVEFDDMDRYLRGLAEVPSSFPLAALEAQAVAGRSYALARIPSGGGTRDSCRCHLVSTTFDQFYRGWDHESGDAAVGGRWVTAVNNTTGKILRYEGRIAETLYSSSHGGHSEASEFVFANALPYIRPVADSRWDLESDNPYRRWTYDFTAAELGSRVGVGTVTAVNLIDPKGAGGRVGDPAKGWGGVEFVGTTGTVTLSGNRVRQILGLRSTLFGVGAGPTGDEAPAQPAPQPSSQPPAEQPPAEQPPSEEPPAEQPAPQPAPTADGGELARVAGSNRIITAIQVSRAGWESADQVVLAAADRFPDALAGVSLAAQLDAPLLLSGTGSLPAEVAEELRRLGTTTVWMLGGTSALSTDVRAQLADMDLLTRRLAGDSRFSTAAEIATTAVQSADEVLVVPGGDWPDAVSAASLAALDAGPPILLTNAGSVPVATREALAELSARRVTVVGGPGVVSDAVVDELRGLGYDVRRVAGANRYATSTAVAEDAVDVRAGTVPVIIAAGGGFADALPAGALAARRGAVVLLAPQRTLEHAPDLVEFIGANDDRLSGDGVVVGGTSVISDQVERDLEAALRG